MEHPTVVPESEKDRVTVRGLACNECGRAQCSNYQKGASCPRVSCDGTLVRFESEVKF
jgi:hypothetical protein